MSLADIYGEVQNIKVLTSAISDDNSAFQAQASTTFTNINNTISKGDDILNKLSSIEDLLRIILILVAVFISVVFLYWFVGHVIPIFTGHHRHKHDVKHVLEDMTTQSVRQLRKV